MSLFNKKISKNFTITHYFTIFSIETIQCIIIQKMILFQWLNSPIMIHISKNSNLILICLIIRKLIFQLNQFILLNTTQKKKLICTRFNILTFTNDCITEDIKAEFLVSNPKKGPYRLKKSVNQGIG
jgi:hypothetical protein